jgi:hypothetical protein
MVTRKRPAAKKSTKKVKAAGRKRASPALNKARLESDKAYYEEYAFDTNRRTKPSDRHKHGIQLKNLNYDDSNDTYVSGDKSVRISSSEYRRLAINPKAVPRYTPIKKGKKIVAFYNTQTKHVVSPYYRYQIFGKEFRQVDTEEQVERATAYTESLVAANRQRAHARMSLIDSYVIRHPEFKENYSAREWRNAVANDPNFISLVEQLQTFNYKQYGITLENIETIDTILGGSYDDATVKREQGELIAALGTDPEYQRILMELGRRTPDETRPIGSYPHGSYIKMVVKPYYAK